MPDGGGELVGEHVHVDPADLPDLRRALWLAVDFDLVSGANKRRFQALYKKLGGIKPSDDSRTHRA